MAQKTQIGSESNDFGNYNVIDVVDVIDFVNASTDGSGTHDECVSVVPRDDGTVAFLRLVEAVTNGADTNARIATVVDARFLNRGSLSDRNPRRPVSITYHDFEAATLLVWLRSLARERNVDHVTVEYYAKNNSPLIEDAGLNNESLFAAYKTEAGRTEEIGVGGVYANDIQMAANF